MAQITVKDTGKGISADVLPCIFERFRQAEPATTRVYGGLGLGLAIVRYLVEMHSGTVYAASEGEGMGATFTVQLPLMESQNRLPLDERPLVVDNLPSLDGLRVLVVDDQTDTLELIAFILSEYGADVRTAASASEAFDAIAQSVPDILISDIGMPEEDGYSLLARVRSLPAEQGGLLPAIGLTAFAREEERTCALKAGFSRHVPKPVEPAELVIVVANVAGRI
jgi:CheY-like chemotaxis protein